ncbi:hypothetical protein FOMPIDRAFT_22863, partial [Fomitopsis schrenkii]
LTLQIGSVYILILVSLQGLRNSLGSSAGTLATDVGNVLRWPDNTVAGKMVLDTIVPAIDLLARNCPISL